MSPSVGPRSRKRGGRAVVVVSRFNEDVTRRLLDGAVRALERSGWPAARVDIIWVPGAFELPLAVDRALATGRYRLGVALGAVIRGETPHFEYVASAAAQGLQEASVRSGVPVGFGVLTCDTEEQALARAGGDAGNKGVEAAESAVEMVRVLDTLADGAEA
ncbi:MAG: 6,7-dimethyl-8-ribityllumazine synthase [Gemmatimonadetes bacterium]|nr:6,7-dimethyl-8-ribityllumazine synthase [Gemmatimonadota bacterium]MBI2401905.1 6,7-dimethyl-8-ribityllumazine synthase [Gemmatimonadota bacterium]MBI2616410.1 6,7-dimethyl-8-ribityllumazine synthase [Gemmatimonadota bacterium]